MKQNFKPITKQLIIAVIILSSVTVLSFGIRRIRFSAYRADSSHSIPSASPSDNEDRTQPKQPLYTDAESDYYPEDSYIADTESDPQDTEESFWDEQVSSEDYSEENTDSVKYDKTAFKTKSFKGGYAKSVGKNGPRTISISDYENLHLTEEGEYWYVSKEPGGEVTKMQVQIDGNIGELIVVGGGSSTKQNPQRIPMGEYENIYLTDEGEAWYVNEQPDGETVKMQVQPD